MTVRSCFVVLALASLAGCQTARPSSLAPAAAPTPLGQDFLVRRAAFSQCELEGFMALTAARGALVFGDTKEKLSGGKSPSPWRTAMVEDLFANEATWKVRGHPPFAAEKFYACAERERLGLKPEGDAAAVCFARMDIAFYLDVDRRKGRTQEQALARFKSAFAKVPKDLFPDELVEKLAPMVFRVSSDEGEYELRRFVLETCLFPQEWKQWWEAVGSKQG